MIARRPLRLEELTLFASDADIAKALLGCSGTSGSSFGRSCPRGPVFGLRYVPAVRRWLDCRHGLIETGPMAIDGRENFDAWKPKVKRKPKAKDSEPT